jgi:acyl-CoA synthetase (AMP-forming)/AMP-acid ligase II
MTRTFNLADLFEIVAAAVPERIAFVCGPQSLSFRELDQRATRLASALRERGVRRGHNVGLQLVNSSEYLEGFFACCKIGAVPVNVNYRYKTEELAFLYASLELRALIYGAQFGAEVRGALPRSPSLGLLLHCGDGTPAPNSLAYEAVLAEGSGELSDPERSGQDLCIICTGGTTGMPKGVMWPHHALFLGALGGGGIYFQCGPVESPEALGPMVAAAPALRYLACAPLMHGAAMWATLISLFAGHTVVMNEQQHFSAEHVWDIVVRDRVNVLSIVGDAMALPLIQALESNRSRWDLSSLYVFGNGGASFSGHLPHVKLNNNIGSSEAGLMGGGDKQVQGEGLIRISPRPDLALIDDAHRIVTRPGSEGILARTGCTPIGYYGDAVKTAETFISVDERVWAMTGDRARIDDSGDIVVLGRGSQCINTGGEKVFPEEVEEVARRYAAVGDVLVVGLPDERWGQRVTAVVEVAAGASFSAAELDRICHEHLSGYKVPKQVFLADKVLRSPAGKADYRWAKEFALKGRAL